MKQQLWIELSLLVGISPAYFNSNHPCLNALRYIFCIKVDISQLCLIVVFGDYLNTKYWIFSFLVYWYYVMFVLQSFCFHICLKFEIVRDPKWGAQLSYLDVN